MKHAETLPLRERDMASSSLYRVKQFIVHPKFTGEDDDLGNDIGLIELEQSIREFDERVQPICLPKHFRYDRQPFGINAKAVIAGWGLLKGSIFFYILIG